MEHSLSHPEIPSSAPSLTESTTSELDEKRKEKAAEEKEYDVTVSDLLRVASEQVSAMKKAISEEYVDTTSTAASLFIRNRNTPRSPLMEAEVQRKKRILSILRCVDSLIQLWEIKTHELELLISKNKQKILTLLDEETHNSTDNTHTQHTHDPTVHTYLSQIQLYLSFIQSLPQFVSLVAETAEHFGFFINTRIFAFEVGRLRSRPGTRRTRRRMNINKYINI